MRQVLHLLESRTAFLALVNARVSLVVEWVLFLVPKTVTCSTDSETDWCGLVGDSNLIVDFGLEV